MQNDIVHLQHKPIIFYEVESLSVDVTGLSVIEAEKKLLDSANGNFINKIVTLRVFGELVTGYHLILILVPLRNVFLDLTLF